MFEIIFLGAIQGITEFLPISSSAHLSVFQILFGFENMLGYDVILHMATLLAVLFFFKKDIISLVVEWLNGFLKLEYRKSIGWRYGWIVLCGNVITAAIALPMKEYVEKAKETPIIIAIGLLLTSLMLWLLWYMGKKFKESEISLKSGLLVGLIQGIAVMPGISRSGSTIFMGRLAGLSPEEAFRFSFLMSVPAIVGATFLEILDMFKIGEVTLPPYWWAGAFLAFSLGLLSLILLRKFVISGRWRIFSIYCASLAILMMLLM